MSELPPGDRLIKLINEARKAPDGVPVTPRPSREALMRAEIQRRANVLKGKPKFIVIKGDKK